MSNWDSINDAVEAIATAIHGDPEVNNGAIRLAVLDLVERVSDGSPLRTLSISDETRTTIAEMRKRRLQRELDVVVCECCSRPIQPTDQFGLPKNGVYDGEVWTHQACEETAT